MGSKKRLPTAPLMPRYRVGAWMRRRVSAPMTRHGTTPVTPDVAHRSFVANAAQ
jgi:hypothetical protein